MKISIITPVFNAAKTVQQTLNSILEQEVSPVEHIIIDGVSTDGTLEILHQYKRLAPYPVLIKSEKDNGIYDAMNKGILLSKGDLLGILNADDWYEAGALEAMTIACRKNGPGIYTGIQRYWLEEKEYYLERVNPAFLDRKMIQHPATFVSRSIYEKWGIFNTDWRYSADLEMFGRFLLAGLPFYQTDSIIANFRIGGASSTIAAAKESLRVRHQYGFITNAQFRKKMFTLKLKQLVT